MGDIDKKEQEEIKKDYQSIIDDVVGTLSSKDSTEIDTATQNLIDLKSYIGEFEQDRQSLEDEISQCNQDIINLRKANNRLMRQISINDTKDDEIEQESQRIDDLNNIF